MGKYLDKYKLKNKISYVVGGCGLIGKEISIALSEAGSKTFILDINNEILNFSQNDKNNEKIRFEYFDCGNLDSLEENFSSIMDRVGSPDIFINCSYPRTKDWGENSFEHIKFNSFRTNIDLHLNSYSWLAKVVAHSMEKKRRKYHSIRVNLWNSWARSVCI